MPRSKGRVGRPYRRLRQQVVAAGTHCELCGEPVDKTLRFPHPMSPSLDHRLPLSRGGAPLARANAGLAHLGCNSRKRDGRRPKAHRTTREW